MQVECKYLLSNMCSWHTDLHSWGSRTGRPLWGTAARRGPETSGLVARPTAADRTGCQTEWRESAWGINTVGSGGYGEWLNESQPNWRWSVFNMRPRRPTMAWVFRRVSSYCGSPDIQPEGRSRHPRPDSRTESWTRMRPPSVKHGGASLWR